MNGRTLALTTPMTFMLIASWLMGRSPSVEPPSAAMLQSIQAKTQELAAVLQTLRDKGVGDNLIADVEIFHKAAQWIVRHGEWYHKDYAQWTLEALERGQERAALIRQAKAPWIGQPGRISHGYRSAIDGSVQPLGLILPKNFGKEEGKRWRLDVVLHGRDATLTEVKFLHQNDPRQASPDQDFIQLNIFGRRNNAYRWAGEMDVYEAIFATNQILGGRVDMERIVLRGFSMGGAGAWHLGLKNPSFWCSVSPGAGFTTTHGYIKNLPDRLADHEEKTLRIYDAVNYAENAFNVPIVAYGGDQDPQLQAARNIEARLKPLGIPMTLLVGPNTPHRYHPDSLKEIMRLQAEHAARGRPAYPPRVRFVAYSWHASVCAWVTLIEQEKQYERSRIDATWKMGSFDVETENVRMLRLLLPEDAKEGQEATVQIDGQTLAIRPQWTVPLSGWPERLTVVLQKAKGGWRPSLWGRQTVDSQRMPRKNMGRGGPIDSVFAQPFLCVRGTGKPWHAAPQAHAEAELRRFQEEWQKYFRGELLVKKDHEVTQADLESRHLVLFGDPSSNSLIAQAIERLPLEWDADSIRFAGRTYASDHHLPALVYPSPFDINRCVVLNSGHTFHAAEFEGTNALLYPRLGDYAIWKLEDGKAAVVQVGLFDEAWKP